MLRYALPIALTLWLFNPAAIETVFARDGGADSERIDKLEQLVNLSPRFRLRLADSEGEIIPGVVEIITLNPHVQEIHLIQRSNFGPFYLKFIALPHDGFFSQFEPVGAYYTEPGCTGRPYTKASGFADPFIKPGVLVYEYDKPNESTMAIYTTDKPLPELVEATYWEHGEAGCIDTDTAQGLSSVGVKYELHHVRDFPFTPPYKLTYCDRKGCSRSH